MATPSPGNCHGALMMIEIKTFPAVRVAYMRHVGPYGHPGIAEMWPRFTAWCAAQGFMRPRRKMFGISQDSPDVTPPEKCRYDACIEVDASFAPTGEVGLQSIAGGTYACTLFTGPATQIAAAWMAFFAQVMSAPDLTLVQQPPFELYPTDYTINEATGVFTCWLCVPVKAF